MQAAQLPPQAIRFALFFFAYYAYVGIFSPYASLYFSANRMSAAEIAILMSLMSAVRIPGPNLWGWLADTTGRRAAVLRASAVVSALAMMWMFVGVGFTQFFLIMLLLNLGTSAQAPIAEALMLVEMRGDFTHYGRLRLWGSIGFILAVSIGGPTLDRLGISSLPYLSWGVLLMVLLASFGIREQTSASHDEQKVSALSQLRKPEVQAFFVSTFMTVAAHASLYVFYSLYLEQSGHSKMFIGAMWSIGVLVEIVFFYFQSHVFKRVGVRRLMLFSLALAVIRFAMIGWLGDILLCLMLAQVMHSITFAAHQSSAVMTMQKWFSGALQARGQALFISISYGMGATLGGLVFGEVWPLGGPRAVFGAASAMAALGLLAMCLSYRWQDASANALANEVSL